MDELEDLHTEQIYVFTTMEAGSEGWDPVKLALAPHLPHQ